MKIIYPDVEAVIEANKLVLREIKALKADRHEIPGKGREKLHKVLEDVKSSKGDVYDKAANLLRGIVQAHAFASGNRRTAYAVTKEFLLHNIGSAHTFQGKIDQVLQGIRENFYIHEEIVG